MTRIGHEPWHFRYVGTPHAQIMAQMGLALEEYIALIKEYRYGEDPFVFQSYNVSYVRAAGEVTEIAVDDAQPYSVSGNNCDGFIVTERRIV